MIDSGGAKHNSNIGTTLIFLPQEVVQLIFSNVEGLHVDIQGEYMVPCDTKDLPPIAFIMSGHRFTLNPEDYILPKSASGTVSTYTQVGGASLVGGKHLVCFSFTLQRITATRMYTSRHPLWTLFWATDSCNNMYPFTTMIRNVLDSVDVFAIEWNKKIFCVRSILSPFVCLHFFLQRAFLGRHERKEGTASKGEWYL